ncbi:MAG: hypothetical protein FGM15_01420 [Chthoniobacterales bacterium]|nr:hypothetical protein [Chthoniobacterales bacterium]
MAWEHHSEPLAPGRVFVGRMARQMLLVVCVVGVTLAGGIAGYMIISKDTEAERLDFVDSFLEASMLLSGAGPLYTERESSNALKMFSSLYALFGTLVVVSSVGILASPIVHRVLHRLHLERGKERSG